MITIQLMKMDKTQVPDEEAIIALQTLLKFSFEA